jgi:hypothetical protein
MPFGPAWSAWGAWRCSAGRRRLDSIDDVQELEGRGGERKVMVQHGYTSGGEAQLLIWH